jgi:hypothetical protein
VNILGINYYFHGSSACLVADGKIDAAITRLLADPKGVWRAGQAHWATAESWRIHPSVPEGQDQR